MQKSPLVAIDTNFPLLLAQENETAADALDILRKRVKPSEIIVPPTVFDELLFQTRDPSNENLRALAKTALSGLRSRWDFHPVTLDATQGVIVEEAARKIMEAGILPPEERNDATIIAESALLNSILIVSNDSHLLEADHRSLGLLFRELDLPVPLIISPREILQKFYR